MVFSIPESSKARIPQLHGLPNRRQEGEMLRLTHFVSYWIMEADGR